MKTQPKTQAASQRGTTLIEVLVAVLVLSLGLLGLAGLQGISLRSNGNAYLRTQATNTAYEILDQIRANRQQIVRNGGPSNAQVDQWEALVAATLPGGVLEVTGPGGNALVCTPADCHVAVRLNWADATQRGTEQAQATAAGYDTTDAALQWFEMDTRI